MDLYSILKFVHLVCAVYWVGGSVCVLISALALKNSKYDYEQRRMLTRLSLDIDVPPRIAMVIITPIGLHLANMTGLVVVSAPVLLAVWVGVVIWLGGEYITHGRESEPFAVKVYISIGVIMLVACLGVAPRQTPSM